MASRFSDVFRSDENQSDQSSQTSTDQNADANVDASNDGISVQNESWSQDEEGNQSYDSTSADTGSTDAGTALDVDNMLDSMTNSSSSSDSSDLLND